MNVLISGASVAGPALAYWLRRHGYGVTVVERAPGLRPGGQAIDVRGPALAVAERMGVLEAIRRDGTNLRGVSMVDPNGEELFRSTDYTASGGAVESPDVEILRDDLVSIIVGAGGDGVEYLFGDSIAALEQDEHEVRVRFDGGTSRTFDLVVAADGLHSSTRALVFGPEREHLRPLGTGLIAVWTAPNFLGLDRWQTMYQVEGEPMGGMAMSVRGNAELRVYFGFDDEEAAASFDPRDAETHKRLIARRFGKAAPPVDRFLEYMWDAPDFHCDTMAQIHMDTWSDGRVALLGDAGYCGSPASGQGTSVAMLGAYVLAGELKAADGDHRKAFAAYEEELRGYVAANQQLAITNAERMQAVHASAMGEASEEQERAAAALEEDYKMINSFVPKEY
ncbi:MULTISPECIES: FAD-dependent monooxygenase [Actinomadura]|uniref:FAD-dependent monooxygenase n=1 Tax=Actinomadura yumaensis TaxID=111807 RepID=A0ABW2CRE0_9ACTN|nr:FAD-dependent monooxygenase [Actinomadura sp. J1-007]MWK36016.1 FAD-dependent oxidoreductase [Actinomadura sp. J1-007]